MSLCLQLSDEYHWRYTIWPLPAVSTDIQLWRAVYWTSCSLYKQNTNTDLQKTHQQSYEIYISSRDARFQAFIFTVDFAHNTPTCQLQRFSDDSAIAGLIRDGDETEYRELMQDFVAWCLRIHFQINAGKTKELTAGSRRQTHAPPTAVNGHRNTDMLQVSGCRTGPVRPDLIRIVALIIAFELWMLSMCRCEPVRVTIGEAAGTWKSRSCIKNTKLLSQVRNKGLGTGVFVSSTITQEEVFTKVEVGVHVHPAPTPVGSKHLQ